jgi:hypothetical protein
MAIWFLRMYSVISEMYKYLYWKQVLYLYFDVVNILDLSMLRMDVWNANTVLSNRNIEQDFFFVYMFEDMWG